jgi:hypothetical protein
MARPNPVRGRWLYSLASQVRVCPSLFLRYTLRRAKTPPTVPHPTNRSQFLQSYGCINAPGRSLCWSSTDLFRCSAAVSLGFDFEI